MLLGLSAPNFAFNSPRTYIGSAIGSHLAALSFVFTGLFDEVHFYAVSSAHKAEVLSGIQKLALPNGVVARVYFDWELSTNLSQYNYDVFFHPDLSLRLGDLCCLREKYGASFRVIGLAHSLSSQDVFIGSLYLLLSRTNARDLVLCSSSAAMQVLRKLIRHVKARCSCPNVLHARLSILPFGLDTQRFRPGDRDRARSDLRLPADTQYILCLGRLDAHYKYDVCPLLEAFKLAQSKLHGKWVLILAGAVLPSYLRVIRELIKAKGLSESVALFPDVDETTKLLLYQASDLFVAPSDNIQESFGIAVIEAMACGLPVIASDWDGYRDTVVEGRTGYRIPTYMPVLNRLLADPELIYVERTFHLLHAQAVAIDLRRFTEAVVKLGNDPTRRLGMAVAARSHACTKYDQSIVAAQLRGLLQSPNAGALGDVDSNAAQKLGISQMSPWELFAHYCTGPLDVRSRLQVTAYGAQFVAREVSVYIDPELESHLLLDLARNIVGSCASGRSLRSLMSAAESSTKREQLLYTIYWLVKQGFLEAYPFGKKETIVV
jgi:D-inositol-3-phosphate glycosyltransferase